MTESLKTAGCTSCAGGASCGCGGACGSSSGSCQGGPLQRPEFFSGQLLTEDDLQLLSDYVANKSRLHNRFLHGDGVVCGLLVMCHPCGGGRVVVQSGTALDCCGNQIIVPCPVELNINEMVRTLRVNIRGGYDCGDPCEDIDKDCNNGKSGKGAAKDEHGDTDCVEKRGRRYCLYVKYCETREEPVAPYASNGDCAVQVCKPTRIREGYEFELRCPEKEPPPDDVWRRIRCCIGDLTRADKAAQDASSANLYFQRTNKVLPMVRAAQVPEFTDTDVELLQTGTQKLAPLQKAVNAKSAADAAAKEDFDEPEVRRLLDVFQSTAAAIVRYDLQPKQALSSASAKKAGDLVGQARAAVSGSGMPLRKLAMAKMSSARDKLVADVWISQGLQWTDANLAPEQTPNEQRLLYAYNAPHSAQLQKQFSHDLGDLRAWLLDRLERRPLFSDCRLRHDVLAIDLPSDVASQRDYETSEQLVYALLRYLIDCICAALNPPCQPCEDSAVKLACLTVEDCEVISICNLERKFVLSGPAFRYWVPFLHAIGELFERVCCDFRLPQPKPEPEPEQPPAGIAAFPRKQMFMAQTTPTYAYFEDAPELSTLFSIAGIDEQMLSAAVNFGGNLVKLSDVEKKFMTPAFSFAGRDVGTRVTDAAVTAVLERPQIRHVLVGDVERDVVALRRRVDEAAPAAAREDLMQELTVKIEHMVSEANKASAKTIKELRDRVAKLERSTP